MARFLHVPSPDEPLEEDPLAGIGNLFDVSVVFIVGLMIALYFQSFTRDGRPESPATRVTTTSASSSIPAIKPWDSGFALLWNEHDPITGDGHGGANLKSQVVFRLLP
jgi:hypothetical protein